MSERGGIRNFEAYARGKMLDHSAWQKGGVRLPRLITPSDIDAVIDSAGWVLFWEISSAHADWSGIPRGQTLLFENAIFQTTNCAVVCRHSVPLSEARPIDTRHDISAFQAMVYAPHCGLVRTQVFEGNNIWQRFVLAWAHNAKKTHSGCVENASRRAA